MFRRIEIQRRGAYVRVVLDRLDGPPATDLQLDAFDTMLREHRALPTGVLNSPTLQVAWFERRRLPAIIPELDTLEALGEVSRWAR